MADLALLGCTDCDCCYWCCNDGEIYLDKAIKAWNNNNLDVEYGCFECFKKIKNHEND